MSCTQASFLSPKLEVRAPNCASSQFGYSHTLSLNASAIPRERSDERFPKLVYNPLRSRGVGSVCFAKEGSKGGSEGFSWDSLRNAMGGMKKEPSVQSWIKEQMRKQEYDGDGGDGGPRGGGGSGDGSSDEEDDVFDDVLQFVLATLGIIFVYVYLLTGGELLRLAKDYIKYLLGSRPSLRLSMAMRKWGKFYQSLLVYSTPHEDWLERKIVTTPTWWHDPQRLAAVTEKMLRSQGYTNY